VVDLAKPAHFVLVDFLDEVALASAVRVLHENGVTPLDTLSPIEVALPESLVTSTTKGTGIAAACLISGLCGLVLSYGIQWWINVWSYPLDVGGRPLHSAPAFIPLTFEGTVLCAAFGAFFAFLWSARLPKLAHPTFAFTTGDRHTRDRFAVVFAVDVDRWVELREVVERTAPVHVELIEAEAP
jgi:hypothetical protein